MKPSIRTENWSRSRHARWRCACTTDDDTDLYCNGSDPYCHTNTSCFTSVHWEGHYIIKKGCSSTLHCPTQTDIINLQCCYSDLCNQNNTLQYPPGPRKQQPCNAASCGGEVNPMLIAYILIPMLITVVILAVAMVICNLLHRRRMRLLRERVPFLDGELKAEQCGDSTLQELIESSTTGSGSGLPLLIQRTVARQISLVDCIGKGRYGEVWRGVYQGDNMAVKIFSSRDEKSWERESQIYNTVLLRHDNILGFLASDLTSKNGCTQLWLITQYHVNGSLYDYLHKHALSHEELLLLLHTASAGLVHLHTELIGSHSKPAIAHRDIKSKNILVRSDGSCCIADLGLAVIHSERDNVLDLGSNNKVGTKRYMAPELLDETLNTHDFESFKKADMYAFGLVMWEASRRCITGGHTEEYQPPYYNVLPSDPSFEDVKKVVCVQGERPTLQDMTAEDVILMDVGRIMRECWYHNPNTRLTMLRVKKSLFHLLQKVQELRAESV